MGLISRLVMVKRISCPTEDKGEMGQRRGWKSERERCSVVGREALRCKKIWIAYRTC